jgi:hypothetical protein
MSSEDALREILVLAFASVAVGSLAIIALTALLIAGKARRAFDELEYLSRSLKGIEARLADIGKSLISIESRIESEDSSGRRGISGRISRKRSSRPVEM